MTYYFVQSKRTTSTHAVVIKSQDGGIAGHVPVELSEIFHKFLEDYGEILLECIGFRYNRGEGKGLELPIDCQFVGNLSYLKSVRTSLKSKGLKLDITKIRPSSAVAVLLDKTKNVRYMASLPELETIDIVEIFFQFC